MPLFEAPLPLRPGTAAIRQQAAAKRVPVAFRELAKSSQSDLPTFLIVRCRPAFCRVRDLGPAQKVQRAFSGKIVQLEGAAAVRAPRRIFKGNGPWRTRWKASSARPA